MGLASLSCSPLGDPAADGEGGDSRDCRQEEYGDHGNPDQLPVFQDADYRRNKQYGEDGTEKAAGFPDLFHLYDLQTQRAEEQKNAVDGSGDGNGDQTLRSFTRQGEGEDDQKLG